jgi:cytochrome oxidase Cu insertion factor (SCO1/SenC/PrrC family)
MSFKELQEQARALDPPARRKLMAFLVSLDEESDQSRRERLAAMIDDKNPENWISWEEAKERLAADE